MKEFLTQMKKSRFSLLLALVLATGLLIGGCGGGSDSYDDPTVQTLTLTATPLIEAEILKSWMDQGLVNSNDFENVVILQVDSLNNYTSAHIPGAYLWNSGSELTFTRLEALADAGSSVTPGPVMDTVLSRSGVDRFSTIVITYSGTSVGNNATRAYFTLRYWGFPKERIKMLNGGNAAWAAAVTDSGWDAEIYGLTTERPLETISNTFSVRENKVLRADLRYSLGEMIEAVDANNISIAAGEGPKFNIIQQTTGARAMANAIGRASANFSASGYFKTAEEVKEILFDSGTDDALGVFVEGLPSITHCASGMSCTPIFFAMDAILGWDITVYDGSTNQWNAYKAKSEGTTGPVPNDAWRTDLFGRSNGTGTTNTNVIQADLNFSYLTTDDPRANQTETEDALYMAPASSGPPTSIGGGDQSGC